jgi:type IV secretion system protein VirD4
LLTQGEILQLPETDEVVMLSGAPPVRAKKARYYADPRLQGRIQKPPQHGHDRTGDLPTDDWSQLPVVKPVRSVTPQGSTDEDQANGGVRREPELPLHVEIAPPPIPQVNEFDFGGDGDGDEDVARSERLRARMVANSRQAALDPGDGIDL